MTDSLIVSASSMRAGASALRATADGVRGVDLKTPLDSVAKALPGAASAGAASGAAYDLGAAVTVWAGQVDGTAGSVDKALVGYQETDQTQSEQMERVGPTKGPR